MPKFLSSKKARLVAAGAAGAVIAASAASTVMALPSDPIAADRPAAAMLRLNQQPAGQDTFGQGEQQLVSRVFHVAQLVGQQQAQAHHVRAAASGEARQVGQGQQHAATAGSPKEVAQGMFGHYGWSSGEFGCLSSLWTRESGWDPTATNPSSGAFGIPQALPGAQMVSAGADWRTNPATQIKWGLTYIKDRYSSPCGAWAHEMARGWY